MLKLSYNRNHLITTVVDGSNFTSNHMFGRVIWVNCPSAFLKIWKI